MKIAMKMKHLPANAEGGMSLLERACAGARASLLLHDIERLAELMGMLSAQVTLMFDRAVQLPSSAEQKFMLSKVLEARLVQRRVWKSACAAAPDAGKSENLAQTANSIGVVMLLLSHPESAKQWFRVALNEAPREGMVYLYVHMNFTAILNLEDQASGASTPEHVELEAPVGGLGLDSHDASLVLATDSLLMRVASVLAAYSTEAQVAEGLGADAAAGSLARPVHYITH